VNLRATLAAAALGLGVVAMSACQPAAPVAFHSIDLTGATYATSLELPDAQGQTRRLSEFKGRVVVVFFGYTQCPDVCPTTLAELAALRQALGPEGARVQPVFVTVDPERDTPTVLQAYAQAFGADVVALRGDEAQTRQVAKDFKVYYARVAGSSPSTYTLDHTAGLYVFDPQGRLRLFSRHGAPVEGLKADLKALLAGR